MILIGNKVIFKVVNNEKMDIRHYYCLYERLTLF